MLFGTIDNFLMNKKIDIIILMILNTNLISKMVVYRLKIYIILQNLWL